RGRCDQQVLERRRLRAHRQRRLRERATVGLTVNRVGKFRIVEASPHALRLRKKDGLALAHAVVIALQLSMIAFAPFVEVPFYIPASIFAGLGLMIVGLLRMGRRGSRGAITHVVRSFEVVSPPAGDYRAAPQRWID